MKTTIQVVIKQTGAIIERTEIQRDRYQVVRYRGRYYQVFGGVRTAMGITLALPCGKA